MSGSSELRSPGGASYEEMRQAALDDLHILGGGPDATLDRIARIAMETFQVPLAYVSLISATRQILKTTPAVPVGDGSRESAFCARTINSENAYVIVDALEDPQLVNLPQVKEPPFARSYWGMPLKTRSGFNIGAFCVIDFKPREPSPVELRQLAEFATLTMDVIELRAQATTDMLTGLHTRRSFFHEGGQLYASHHRVGLPMSCIVIDVDHFKEINDRHGHAVGDVVLRRLGTHLSSRLRSNTLIGRLGGEEFAIILPGEDLAAALWVAERLRESLPEMSPPELPSVSASFGVTTSHANDRSLEDMLQRADMAAYDAKHEGRNRVCYMPPGGTNTEIPSTYWSGDGQDVDSAIMQRQP